ARVEGARITGGSRAGVRAAGSLADAGTNDDQILINGGGREDRVRQVHAGLHHFGCLQIEDAVLAKRGVQRSIRSLQGIEAAGIAADDDRGWIRSLAWPVGEAALRGDVVIRQRVLPLWCAGGGVERVDRAVG